MIVPSFGRSEILHQLVLDLLAQVTAPKEIIVIHQQPNLSSVYTHKLRVLAQKDRIQLKEAEFTNAQRARNLGILQAVGDIVLLLDDDVRVPPHLIEHHLANYEEDPLLDGVVGQVLEVGQSPTVTFPFQHYWPHVGWQHFPLNFGIRSPVINWPSTNSSIRRHVAIEIGGFDEQFECTWLDDTDFSFRLLQQKTKLVFDPRASITHLKIQSGGKRLLSRPSLLLDKDGWMTHFYFWRKNFGLWKARYPILWQLRHIIFRKAVLLRPHWLFQNLFHMIRGYQSATEKLKQGPRYLTR